VAKEHYKDFKVLKSMSDVILRTQKVMEVLRKEVRGGQPTFNGLNMIESLKEIEK
jgi:hypothetical protein